jgi:hypothetical protein
MAEAYDTDSPDGNAMEHVLKQSDIGVYWRDGVIASRDILSVRQTARIREILESLADPRSAEELPGEMRVHRDETGTFLLWPARFFPDLRRELFSSSIPSAVSDLFGGRAVTLWSDEARVKPTDRPSYRTRWHQDIEGIGLSGKSIVTIWIALTDVGAEESPIQTIVGSQEDRSVVLRQYTKAAHTSASAVRAPEMPDIDTGLASGKLVAQTWDCSAGDAIFLDPYMIHGAPLFRGKGLRIVYVTRWVGDDVSWMNPYEHGCLNNLLPIEEHLRMLNRIYETDSGGTS